MKLAPVVFAIAFSVLCAPHRTDAQTIAPDSEKSFLSIIMSYRVSWDEAKNDIVREEVRPSRDRDICRRQIDVKDWIGSVREISDFLNENDAATFSIDLPSDVSLTTGGLINNNGTLIQRGSDLFKVITDLSVNQHVIFSGRFILNQGCPEEISLTDKGSISAPEYLFLFTDVRPDE